MSIDTHKDQPYTLPSRGNVRIRPRRHSTLQTNTPQVHSAHKEIREVAEVRVSEAVVVVPPTPEPEKAHTPNPEDTPVSTPIEVPTERLPPIEEIEETEEIEVDEVYEEDDEIEPVVPIVESPKSAPSRAEGVNLKPLFFRYVLPVTVVTLFLTGMSLTDPFVKTVVPEYSIEAFLNRTPYQYKGSYRGDFNDLNDIQLTAAIRLGVTPAETRAEVASNPRLVPIDCLDVISVDSLTHSQALLVPQAVECLREIGGAFLGRLTDDKLPLYRPILTSGTRTREDIDQLRRGNGNASENSTHMYGTTFDISWKRFEKVDPNDPRSLEPDELKNLLAIVLRDMHDRGRCYVKHEARQACFHITTRP